MPYRYLLPFLLLCACPEPPDDAGEARRAYLLGTADTGDSGTAELEESPEFVVIVQGQSNAGCNLTRPTGFPHSLLGNHLGARVIRNGIELTDYGVMDGPDFIGPEAYVVDELIVMGVPAEDITVVIRCIPGSSIVSQRDTVFPLLLSDFATYALPPPTGILYWQGEADARSVTNGVPTGGQLYQSRLTGHDGQPSLRGLLEGQWPAILWSLVELRVRDPDYAPIDGQQLVRSAQHFFGAYDNVCLIPSYDAELLPGDNQPHTSLVGTETIGRRSVHGWLDPFCP